MYHMYIRYYILICYIKLLPMFMDLCVSWETHVNFRRFIYFSWLLPSASTSLTSIQGQIECCLF